MPNAIESLFPKIFCIEDIQCSSAGTGVNYRATLYHDQACITVTFNCSQCDKHLENGEFVSVCWLPEMHSDHGAIQVGGLTVLDGLSGRAKLKNFNPFLAVPHTFSIDRHLVDCARELWGVSSKAKRQQLMATIFARHGGLGHH